MYFAQFPMEVLDMSCPEIGGAFQAMSNNMKQQLNWYSYSLQTRYGDPRVYAMEQERVMRHKAAVEHEKSKKTSKLLEDAYKRQSEKNRETHKERISTRIDQRSASRPESVAKSHRKPAQPQKQRARQQRDDPSQPDSNQS